MIILITQFVILVFGLLCLYCEVSDKYRDCNWHVSVRWVLMMASILIAFKVSLIASAPILAQIGVLFTTCLTVKFLYRKVLKRQIRIKNFKLKKIYLGDLYVKSINRK